MMSLKKVLGVVFDIFQDSQVNQIYIDTLGVSYRKDSALIKDTSLISGDEDLLQIIESVMNYTHTQKLEGKSFYQFSLDERSGGSIIFPPMNSHGPILSLYKLPTGLPSWDELLKYEVIEQEGIELIHKLLKENKNILVAGPPGSGKTTLLNIIADSLEEEKALVSIEHGGPIFTFKRSCTRLRGDGSDSSCKEVLSAAGSLNKDYIVCALRGPEVSEIFNLAQNGQGFLINISGSDLFDSLRGLENKALIDQGTRNFESIKHSVASSFDSIIFLEKKEGGKRKITRIASIGYKEGAYELDILYRQ